MTLTINTTAKLHHATKAKAEKLDAILMAEYPVLKLEPAYNEDESAVVGWIVYADTVDGTECAYEGKPVPELADLLDACADLGIDPEEGAEEEERAGSVVPEGYRVAYREQTVTSGQTCGDWLAHWLEQECHTIEGFDRITFAGILISNAVDQTGKWASLPESGQSGWVGRWRMNGRQQLEKTIAASGILRDAFGVEAEVPASVIADMRTKHAAFIRKLEKAEAKRAKAELEAVEA